MLGIDAMTMTGQGRVYAEEQAAKRKAEREATGPKWYVVQCGRRTDQQVLDCFDRFRIETYYPRITQFKPMPRRRMSQAQRRSGLVVMQPTEAAVFPRYVFTRFDIQDREWREAFDVGGVSGLMCQSGMPIWMPDAAIETIRAQVGHQIHTTDTMRVLLNVGDEVFVNHGPFASFPGIVEEGLDIPIEKLDAGTRIKVAVNIFGRATPVELEYWQVSKRSD
jgi:transcription antitermination factor NusG